MRDFPHKHPHSEAAVSRPFRIAVGALLSLLLLGLGAAVIALNAGAGGLGTAVDQAMAQSGVKSPVTAVLLNFRAYDTLLELCVLVIALLGAATLAPEEDWEATRPPVILDDLTRLVVPLIVVVTGYLLWAGKAQAGGAFQAGAMLAAAGVLALLNGVRYPDRLSVAPLRWGATIGLIAFIGVGMAAMALGGQFLQYPLDYATASILFIETASTLSIALILVTLFRGGRLGGRA